MPSPTPDIRRLLIAFVSDYARNDDIYLLDPTTGDVWPLVQSPAEERDPVFAPDGDSLAFRSNAGGSWVWYRLDLETGRQTRLFYHDLDLDGRSSILAQDLTTMAYRGNLTWSSQPGFLYAYDAYLYNYMNVYVCQIDDLCRALLAYPPLVYNSNGQRVPTGNYGPAWRPGSAQIAFTSWRDGQKDLYLVDANGQNLVRLTADASDEENPVWHPNSQRIAFVRWQNNDADLYTLDLVSMVETRLTHDPYPDRSPTYAPDGTLLWMRYEPGPPFEVHDPFYPGRWRLWLRTPDGQERQIRISISDMDVYDPTAGLIRRPTWISHASVSPTPIPTRPADQSVNLVRLDIQCAGGDPRLNALLVDDYLVWRADVLSQTGYDFLGSISDMFRPLGYGTTHYGHLSWHRTGRTLDVLQEWHDPPNGPNQLLVVRDDLGPQTYWRLYLRTRYQDGRMGEPITVAPWIGWFNLDPRREPQDYAAGGKPDVIPPGYYVDLTQLAQRYGWHRIASYQDQNFNWKWDSVGMEFWHYERTDGLTWWQAMSQIYPSKIVQTWYGWSVCTSKLGIAPNWLRAKGIPEPAP